MGKDIWATVGTGTNDLMGLKVPMVRVKLNEDNLNYNMGLSSLSFSEPEQKHVFKEDCSDEWLLDLIVFL